MKKGKYSREDVWRLTREIRECNEVTYHNRSLLNEEYVVFTHCLLCDGLLAKLKNDPNFITKQLEMGIQENVQYRKLIDSNTSFSEFKDLCEVVRSLVSDSNKHNEHCVLKEKIRLNLDEYDLERIKNYTGIEYKPFHVYSLDELDNIVTCIKKENNDKDITGFLNEFLINTIQNAKGEFQQMADAHYQIVDALIEGINDVKPARCFYNMNDVEEYAQYIFEIIKHKDRSIRSPRNHILDSSVIEEAIKIANLLPVESLQTTDKETYEKIIHADLSLRNIKFDYNNKLYYQPTAGLYGHGKIDGGVVVSFGKYFLDEGAKFSKSKSVLEKRDRELKKLKEILNECDIDFLEDSVLTITQQLKYLLAFTYGADRAEKLINSQKGFIEKAVKDGDSLSDLIGQIEYRIENIQFKENGLWVFDYLNKELKSFDGTNINNLCLTVTEKEVENFWSYGKNKTIKASNVLVTYLLEVFVYEGKIIDLRFVVHLDMTDNTVSKHLKDMRDLDFWSQKEIEKAKELLQKIIK